MKKRRPCKMIIGDCAEEMGGMRSNSVDAIVCDPPYGLEFMGKEWDKLSGVVDADDWQQGKSSAYSRSRVRHGTSLSYGLSDQNKKMQHWHEMWAREAYRVLKPGGHLLAFGGSRTSHRLAAGIEDAGFEIRDSILWLYGTGFPKSLDVSKAIDKAAGATRKVSADRSDNGATLTVPATAEAERWEGWGTALKPAHEPIVVARKPLTGTVAANVLLHGTGALNIDASRIATDDGLSGGAYAKTTTGRGAGVWRGSRKSDTRSMRNAGAGTYEQPTGRWPANVILDPTTAMLLDKQSDASRFFYVAKASRAERNAGLDEFEKGVSSKMGDGLKSSVGASAEAHGLSAGTTSSEDRRAANIHPTVKPLTLMRYLVALVTPPGGIVLDPFVGSGTTGCAAVLEGFRFIGIDNNSEYAEIAMARIRYWYKLRGTI